MPTKSRQSDTKERERESWPWSFFRASLEGTRLHANFMVSSIANGFRGACHEKLGTRFFVENHAETRACLFQWEPHTEGRKDLEQGVVPRGHLPYPSFQVSTGPECFAPQ